MEKIKPYLKLLPSALEIVFISIALWSYIEKDLLEAIYCMLFAIYIRIDPDTTREDK